MRLRTPSDTNLYRHRPVCALPMVRLRALVLPTLVLLSVALVPLLAVAQEGEEEGIVEFPLWVLVAIVLIVLAALLMTDKAADAPPKERRRRAAVTAIGGATDSEE